MTWDFKAPWDDVQSQDRIRRWRAEMCRRLNIGPAEQSVNYQYSKNDWADHYRRVHSKARLTLDEETIKLIPSSGDAKHFVGFVPKPQEHTMAHPQITPVRSTMTKRVTATELRYTADQVRAIMRRHTDAPEGARVDFHIDPSKDDCYMVTVNILTEHPAD